ncbi:uncharacterized protein LOC122256115 [Penaeus japonicus]|uniref:uncharacterized protein LOC122256115 n=1 Tax=Penaeus japonicus TaxID=27405 RepID=UPI001C70DFCA|nr:uncharacterized protein LOC122256115 [Penaeus japonicus]
MRSQRIMTCLVLLTFGIGIVVKGRSCGLIYTICVRFRLLNGASPATIFSYTDGEAFEEMNVAVKWPEEELLVMCCYYHVHHYVDVPVKLFHWHHLCVSIDLRANTLELAFDDVTFETTAGRPESTVDLATARVKGYGRFVLGQNVNPSSDWDVTQTFHGEMVDFRYYNTTMPFQDLVKYTTCQAEDTDLEPLYGFQKNLTALELRGSVEVIEAALEEICRPVFSYLIMFTQKMSFNGALSRCRSFVGELAVPHDLEENDRIYDNYIRFNDQCTQGWAALYWLGIEGNISAGTWRNLAKDEPLAWGKWLESWELPTEQYPCATYGGVGIPSMWYNADCSTLTCALCNFTEQPRLRIRGLCSETKFDRNFILYGYENGRPVFEGNFFSRILWDNSTWVMAYRRDPSVEARMVEKRPKGYPLGLNEWDFAGDDCAVPRASMLLTLCGPEDFTCSDGSCIPIGNRCNQVTDCPDKSDELNCQILLIPDGYSSDLPPPTIGEVPLQLLFGLVVTSVRHFDLVGFRMELDVQESTIWRDARLTFSNLKDGNFSNRAKVSEELWLPRISVQDSEGSPTDIQLRDQFLHVNREAPSLPDDDAVAGEDKLYSGSEHRMKLMQQYTMGFMCRFRLQMYPFDSQKCSLTYNLTNMQNMFQFVKGGVFFTGERRLLEYKFVKEEMFIIGNARSVKVVLQFRNQYGYYVGNAFVPSMFMVFICYLTLLFDLADFQDRIMVSLTSLLVLASLFSQTSQSIPKTAYLKHIDVWYIVLITIDFFIIVILVVIENLRLYSESDDRVFTVTAASAKKMAEVGRVRKAMLDYRVLSLRLNRACVLVFPVVSALFVLAFFMIGLVQYYVD